MADTENCNGSCLGCEEDCEGNATITLTLDNNETVECSVLTMFGVADKRYIALLPLNEEGVNEDGEVYLYRYHESNGAPILENIEDDEEYEAAADGFDEWMDTLEFEDLVEGAEDFDEEMDDQ